MSQEKLKPTESEHQILQVLWSLGPSTVRQVNDEINKEKETGYTTTLKLMQIMSEKGLVDRDTSTRTHVYSASVSQKETRNNLLQEFLNNTFQGSAMSLVLQTLGNHSASKEELAEIKKLIDKLENQ